MPYAIRFILFLLAVLSVTGVLGYRSGFAGPWAVVLVILVMIRLTIEVGREVLKRNRHRLDKRRRRLLFHIVSHKIVPVASRLTQGALVIFDGFVLLTDKSLDT